MRRLILRCQLAPGDIVMLTAAVRDLHVAHPGQFLTDVRTLYPEIWEHNPHITPISDGDPDAVRIDCAYPLINHANRAPYHCLHGFMEFLNQRLGLAIKPTLFKGDIHLSPREKAWYSQIHEVTGAPIPFWIVSAGGKYDFTIKWWDTARYQRVVEHFRGRVQFVQVGQWGDHHPKLEGVIDLRGRTSLRELIRLVYHSQGVLCPVTSLMHLAAAVPLPRGRRPARPCVVIAGGREPAQWEAYPGHQFIHTNGALPCCAQGGCWRDRTIPLRDGDSRDHTSELCVEVVNRLPRCMDMISAEEVIGRMEFFFDGGAVKHLRGRQRLAARQGIVKTCRNNYDRQSLNLHSAGLACDEFIDAITPYPDRFRGRGIVICGGGVRYFTNAWVSINMLRRLGCRLPIQVWHRGKKEMDAAMAALLAPLRVETVDASKVRRIFPVRRLGGWELKPYSILHCSFREVIFLDADNLSVVNPEFLLDGRHFRERGALFWPDYETRQSQGARAIWRSCGLRRPPEPEFESGQIVVDKARCWPALCLSLWFNEHSDFYYQHLYGDKETFHLAFRKLKIRYHLAPTPVHRLDGTMCQHDFNGRRIFQHRNRHKWELFGENKKVEGFLFEEECRRFLSQLRNRWNGRIAGSLLGVGGKRRRSKSNC